MKNIYFSVLVGGIVFAFLSLLTGMGTETSITFLFFTLYIVSFLRLIEEWRFFNDYNAPPASSSFLVLISILALTASYTSRLASIGNEPLLRQSIISIFIDVSLLGIFPAEIFLNIFSLLFSLIWFIFLFLLMKRYHSGRYPGIFINRKLFPRFTIIFVNIILILLLVVVWSQTSQIEFSEFIWSLATLVLMLQYYVLKITLVPVRIVSIPFRTQRRRTRRMNRDTSYTSTPQPRLIIPSNNSNKNSPNTISTTPSISGNRSQTRGVTASSTTPRSTTSSPRRSTSQQSRSPTSSSTVSVLPARELGTTNKKSKISASHLPLLLPKAKNLSQDDFRCIFCYELPTEDHKNVIICSNCHHPSHEEEFLEWKSNSDICSFCNARTSSNKIIRLSGKNYSKVIKLALKK
ncbi:MAG: hypothetical protein ACW981_19625 [Candidatus Hodarchaeales archaeon]|jgi:hypothetical protein